MTGYAPTIGSGRPAMNPLREGLRLEQTPPPCTMVIFGVTGDLTHRKLMPQLYDLTVDTPLPAAFSIVGFARRDWSDDFFRDEMKGSVKKALGSKVDDAAWQAFAPRLSYVQSNFDDPQGYRRLKESLDRLDQERGAGGNRIFYLATPPSYYPIIINHLREAGLAEREVRALDAQKSGWTRLVIEKPFGHDLASAQALNNEIAGAFSESQVYRIDHYLGKETVQNLLALRFANQLYEPIWNSNYVDHVQITMAEDIGVGGRAGYYDGIGAARDVIQNHLIQLLALTAMEEPVAFSPQQLRTEKIKVLSAVRLPADLASGSARGQYAGGWQGGTKVAGYLDEDGISPNSVTETYAAVKLLVDTRRWAGVPFYLRTGKRLGKRVTEIAVIFKRAPHLPFSQTDTETLGSNALVIRVQPDEGVTIRFGSKVPGPVMEVRDVNMDFSYGQSFTEASPEAYERLILDVLLGEPSLFPQDEEVELSWRILDPIEKYWAKSSSQPEPYVSGTWGPPSADVMMARDGRTWRRP